MPDVIWRKIGLGRSGKILLVSIFSFFFTMLLLALALNIYLATPLAAAQLSRLLTSHLHQPVRVTGLHTAGCALYITGLSMGNPSDFPAGNLASADSITIAPQWIELLLGRRSFRLIALEGVRLDIMKNSKGGWNFSQLQQVLTAGKPTTVETFVWQLVVKGGALQVNGQGVKGIALQIFNMTTKGSADSRIALAFEDSARNRYQVEGKARPGSDPVFDLTLTAPSLSLDRLARMIKLKNFPALEGGNGQLRVKAELREDRLRVRGGLDFSRLSVPLAQGRPTLAGKLSVSADYNLHTDEARLETLALTVNNLIKAQASGTVANFRSERRFKLDIGIDQFDLGTLALFLPEPERHRLILGGMLGGRAIQLSGNNAQGATSASGSFLLHNGSLIRDGQLIVSGLDGSLSLSGAENGFLAKGRLSRRQSGDKALLETLAAPIEAHLSPRMKPLMVEIPALSAKILGVQLSGRLSFRAAAAEPYSLSLRIPATATAVINPLLEKLELHFSSGTTSLVIDAAGRGPQDFSALVTAQLAAWQVTKGKQAFAVKQGAIDSRLSMSGGKVVATGRARLTGLAVGGQTGDAHGSYRFADGMVTLNDTGLRYGDTSVTIARLAARVPVRESGAGAVRFPLSLEISGAEIRQSQVELKDLSGMLRGGYVSDSGGDRWLEGTAELAAGGASWQGKVLGAPTARLVFSRSGGKGKLSGTLLGGKLSGAVAFNPFAPEEGGAFQLGIRGAQLALAADFLPRRGGVTLSDGLLDASLDGGYSRRGGLAFRVEAKGTGIALAGSGGKNLLSGGGFRLTGALAGQTASISDAVFTAGKGVALKVKGEISNVLSPEREGSIAFALPESSFNDIIDPFVNILPRFLQEASVDGFMAAEGKVALRDGRKLLEGSLLFRGLRLELPSQQLSAADINGRLPFSLDLAGGTVAKTPDTVSFSRENFPRLLAQFRQSGSGGQPLKVGMVRFGPMELGAVTLLVNAGNGITEIVSLKTSLYGGALFAKGFVTIKNGIRYRGDLLIDGLSLKQLCSTFPKIKGYISGRIDGVMSLYGAGTGGEGLVGFSDLWAREGSGESMYVSKEFLQRLAGKKLRGFIFRDNRAYDKAEIKATLEGGYLTFETLDILHTNVIGIRDLSVTIASSSNRIALERLFSTIKQAHVSGKAVSGEMGPTKAPLETEFKWQE